MINGLVNAYLEGEIRLVLLGTQGNQHRLTAVIDTGFSGDLTLPVDVIELLGLTWLGRELGILADG